MLVMTGVLSTNAENVCELLIPGDCDMSDPFCTSDCKTRFESKYVGTQCVEKENHQSFCGCMFRTDMNPCPPQKASSTINVEIVSPSH